MIISRGIERCLILSHHIHMVETLGLSLVELVEIVQNSRVHVSSTTPIPQDGGIGQLFLRFRWSHGVVVVVIGTGGEHRHCH